MGQEFVKLINFLEFHVTFEMLALVTTNKSKHEYPIVGPRTRCKNVDILNFIKSFQYSQTGHTSMTF